MVYAIESEADKIDQALMKSTFKKFKYLSYRRTAPNLRIAAMHANEVLNAKARCETMCNANLKDAIAYDNKEYSLEDFILNQKEQGQKLFMAAEQYSTKYRNNAKVILNPKIKNKARKWIADACPQAIFKQPNENKTSVDAEQCQASIKYDEDLKEFLKLILVSEDASEVKKFSRKMKTYAQSLGIETNIEKEKKNMENQQNQYKKKEKEQRDVKETIQLKQTIKEMSQQIESLKDIVHSLCSILPDSLQKNEAIKTLKMMKNDDKVEVSEQSAD